MENVIINLETYDPFKDANKIGINEQIHIRIQKRNGRKCITIIEGLTKLLDENSSFELTPKKILKHFKKVFSCNGSFKSNVFQLSGNQKENIKQYLVDTLDIDASYIIIHG